MFLVPASEANLSQRRQKSPIMRRLEAKGPSRIFLWSSKIIGILNSVSIVDGSEKIYQWLVEVKIVKPRFIDVSKTDIASYEHR